MSVPLNSSRGSHNVLLQPPVRRPADGGVRLMPHLDPHNVYGPQEARPRSGSVALLQVRRAAEQVQGRQEHAGEHSIARLLERKEVAQKWIHKVKPSRLTNCLAKKGTEPLEWPIKTKQEFWRGLH